MSIRNAFAVWRGDLVNGRGTIKLGSGAFEGSYSFSSRFKDGPGTNPEELIGAALAGCFSMALAHNLAEAGYSPRKIQTHAKVRLAKVDNAFKIASILLSCRGVVPDISEAQFEEYVKNAKLNCPASRALAGTEIIMEATLRGAVAA